MLKLAVLFPSRPGEAPLVEIPLTNPMGWCSSPPNFRACTETVADLANTSLENPFEQATARRTPHRLDTISETAPLDIPLITATHIPSIPCTSPFKNLYGTGIFMWTIFAVSCKAIYGPANGLNEFFSTRSIACFGLLTITIPPFARSPRL